MDLFGLETSDPYVAGLAVGLVAAALTQRIKAAFGMGGPWVVGIFSATCLLLAVAYTFRDLLGPFWDAGAVAVAALLGGHLGYIAVKGGAAGGSDHGTVVQQRQPPVRTD